jgi:RNA polymerase sigma factor (sigma-70 family)
MDDDPEPRRVQPNRPPIRQYRECGITASRPALVVATKGPSMAEGRGDEVLSDLVRQRGRQLTGYAYLFTGDVAAAQDLVQDALIKVFLRTRAGFTPDVAEAYVRRSIVGLYVDGFRRRRKWALLRPLVATADIGEEPELSTADRIDLRAALATLAPQERACVVLRFYEDMTIAEIAEQMRLAPGTVKRYLSNAIHKLQARLGPVAVPKEGETIAFAPLPLAGTGAPPVRSSGSPAGGRS